jgi:cytochrome c-type biogenesis protein CcmE
VALTPPPAAEDEDLPPVDVTPRPVTRRRRRLPVVIALVVVLGALVFIAVKSLGDASLFFYNADEAVERRDELGDTRFRLQGTVEPGTVDTTDDGVTFQVVFNDVEVDVTHQGDPPELFQPDIPVVLEGNWEGETFASDRILVKHSSEYEADNPDRLEPEPTPASDQ